MSLCPEHPGHHWKELVSHRDLPSFSPHANRLPGDSVKGGSAASSQPLPSSLPPPIALSLSPPDDRPAFFRVTALHLVHCINDMDLSVSCKNTVL